MDKNTPCNGIVLTKSNGKILVSVHEEKLWCRLGSQDVDELPVVGDQVLFHMEDETEGLFLGLQPRRSKLSRRAAGSGRVTQEQVIAANVDLVVPVFAISKPEPKWNLLDRYLVMAEAAHIPALICMSKMDQLDSMKPAQQEQILERLAVYRAAGYPVVTTSSLDHSGMAELLNHLHGKTAILMGKSGVGKTSLLNLILPGQDLRVSHVSEKLGKGRHTTTSVTAYAVNPSTYVIDAPGMRELGLWDVDPETLENYFPEMQPFLGRCKFRLNCQHEEEPGCAVRQAVMDGKIDPYRYASYLRLKEDDL